MRKKAGGSSSNTSVNNIKRTLQLKTLSNLDATLLQAAKKHLGRAELRTLQRSVAVMSLASKSTVCLGLISTGDSEVTESSEDGEDACSQGHPRKKRWKNVIY